MATEKQLKAWLEEANRLAALQPKSSWTIARMKLSYPDPTGSNSLIASDTVSAAGNCNAQVVSSRIDRQRRRVELATTFSQFDLRGQSHLIGPFRILLQPNKVAKGVFRQRFADSLFPLQGEWRVPFMMECRFGSLIPRPTDYEVTLRSAEPGEFAIPPIGSWFEKWDPISLVDITAPNGPTIAIVEHAMHCMLNVGSKPAVPTFYKAFKK